MVRGTAFRSQPTLGNNIALRRVGEQVGHEGDYWIGTFEDRHTTATPVGQSQGDPATGALQSDSFTLNSDRMSFLIGGGNDLVRLRVELLIKFGADGRQPSGTLGRHPMPDGDYGIAMFATGRNAEIMRREVWDVAQHRGRTARIRIIDDATGGWGHINVDDFRFGPATPGHVTIIDAAGRNLNEAEVFVNGALVGRTGSTGLDTPLVRGNSITGRVRVHQGQSPRRNDWNYRVYTTTSPVNNDGTVPGSLVGLPEVDQRIAVSPRSALFGLHLTASVEWDASDAELQEIRAKLQDASQFLYNATDGQFYIEQVELKDNSVGFDDADVQILTDWSLRANVPRCGAFLIGGVYYGNVHQSRSNPATTYAHEFGHYCLDLYDEYQDEHPEVLCTAMANTDGAIYGKWMPSTSCMMFNQGVASKICSAHRLNPHRTGTRQGDQDCWSHIAEVYRPQGSIPPSAWVIQTPNTRGFIVPPLPPLPAGWQTRFTTTNATVRDRIQPQRFRLVALDGTPLAKIIVTSHTLDGRSLVQGETAADGTLTMTGLHIGDRITASLAGVNYAAYTIPSTGVVRDPLFAIVGQPRPADFAGDIVLKAEPFQVNVSLATTASPSSVRVLVEAPNTKTASATAEVLMVGSSKPITVPLKGADGRFEGVVSGLPPLARMTVHAIVTNDKNEKSERYAGATLTSLDPKGKVDASSLNNGLLISVPSGNTTAVTVSAGDTVPSDAEVICGPFSVDLGGKNLASPATFRFQVAEPTEKSDSFSAKNLEVRRFDPASQKWTTLQSVHLADVLRIVTFKASEGGTFVLVRPR